jgi:hypothetical protein
MLLKHSDDQSAVLQILQLLACFLNGTHSYELRGILRENVLRAVVDLMMAQKGPFDWEKVDSSQSALRSTIFNNYHIVMTGERIIRRALDGSSFDSGQYRHLALFPQLMMALLWAAKARRPTSELPLDDRYIFEILPRSKRLPAYQTVMTDLGLMELYTRKAREGDAGKLASSLRACRKLLSDPKKTKGKPYMPALKAFIAAGGAYALLRDGDEENSEEDQAEKSKLIAAIGVANMKKAMKENTWTRRRHLPIDRYLWRKPAEKKVKDHEDEDEEDSIEDKPEGEDDEAEEAAPESDNSLAGDATLSMAKNGNGTLEAGTA